MAWFAVCLTVLVCWPYMMSAIYLPKITWVGLTVGIGFLAVRTPRSDRTLSITPLACIWFGFLGFVLLSLTWTPVARVGFERMLDLVVWTLAYALARRTRFWESNAFWDLLSIVLGIVALVGFLQYVPERWMPKALGQAVAWFPDTARPSATLGHRNYASLYMATVLPLVGWRFFSTSGRRSLLAFLALGASILFLLLARTRGAWLACVVGGLFLIVSGIAPRVWAKRKQLAVLLASALLSIVAIAAVRAPTELGKEKATLTGTLMHVLDTDARWSVWQSSWGVANPLIGSGYGGFPIVLTPHLPGGKSLALDWEVHNDYYQAFLELGIPGLLLYAGFLGYLVALAWRSRGQGVFWAAGTSTVVFAAMEFLTFTSQDPASLSWLAGVIAILNAQPAVRPVRTWAARPNTREWLGVAAAAALLTFAYAGWRSIQGDATLRAFEVRMTAVSKLPTAAQSAQANVLRRDIQRLYHNALKRMVLCANGRHIYAHEFASYAFEMQEPQVALAYAEYALALHPNDRSVLTFVAQSLQDKRDWPRKRALCERFVKTFGLDPYSPIPEDLAKFHELDRNESAAIQLRAQIEANRLGVPDDFSPAPGTPGVPSGTALGWAKVPGAEKYRLYLWAQGENKPEEPAADELTANTWQPPQPLDANTVYLWQVEAVNRYRTEKSIVAYFRTQP